MAKDIIRIDKDNKLLKIVTLPEDPYLAINIRGWGSNDSSKENSYALLAYTVNYTDGKKHEDEFIFYIRNRRSMHYSPIISKNRIESVDFELTEGNIVDFHVDIEVQLGRDLINIQNPLTSFQDFINNRINSRILFSGAFGQGKTTFLNFFFDEAYTSYYTVFRVFPVNYSVASNEDIFRYIKSDILFQLLGCNVEFEKKEINIIQSFKEYTYLNPAKTIISFLKNVSKLNSKTEILTKSIDALNDFLKPIKDYQESQKVDYKQRANNYIQEIYEKEGSLFEDNFYTQLIRQLLEKIKEKTGKLNVLIIEDLDRMDPDHIFRILNVISAHYDTYKYNGYMEIHDKFGFDKIMLVCDIDNIRNIFHHRYGIKTDFEGYINKYYSSRPYYFRNERSILKFIEDCLAIDDTSNPSNKKHLLLLQVLFTENQLSLRESLKLILHDFNKFYVDTNGYYLKRGPFTKSLVFLSNIYTPEVLIEKFEIIKIKAGKRQSISYNEESGFLIGALCNREIKNMGSNITSYNNFYYSFEYEEHVDESVFSIIEITEKKKISDGITSLAPFTKADFYDLLIENVKRIKESIED